MLRRQASVTHMPMYHWRKPSSTAGKEQSLYLHVSSFNMSDAADQTSLVPLTGKRPNSKASSKAWSEGPRKERAQDRKSWRRGKPKVCSCYSLPRSALVSDGMIKLKLETSFFCKNALRTFCGSISSKDDFKRSWLMCAVVGFKNIAVWQ